VLVSLKMETGIENTVKFVPQLNLRFTGKMWVGLLKTVSLSLYYQVANTRGFDLNTSIFFLGDTSYKVQVQSQ
jgi:hypothetical protein